jgi:hypothetical protein
MRIKELKTLIDQKLIVDTRIETHATHNQYSIHINVKDEEYQLTNWRNKPLIFRNLEQATEALAQAGIDHSVLVQHTGHEEVIELSAHNDLFISQTPISI